MKINIKIFYKLISLLLVAIGRYAQSTQSNNFAKSLQYLKEKRRHEIDFLHAGKYQTFLQVNAINNIGGQGQSCSKYSK